MTETLNLSRLWVAEPLRGKDPGRNLSKTAEEEAKSQGCRGIFLPTLIFQARPFYERLGYEVDDIPYYPRATPTTCSKRR